MFIKTKQNPTKRNIVSFSFALAIALLTLFIQNGNSIHFKNNKMEAKVTNHKTLVIQN